MESVSLVTTPSAIELWAGALSPAKAATIELASISSVVLRNDASNFPRAEIRTNFETIPLYAAVGILGISRKSSRRLFDEILSALEDARAVP